MARHLVCLTYDFDAVAPSNGSATTSLSPDFEAQPGAWMGRYGLDRIRRLLDREQVRATFFASGATLQRHPQIGRALLSDGHEIGHHGWSHPRPGDLDRDEEEEELVRGIEAIGDLTGTAPNGYRSPSWAHTPNTVDLLLSYGFLYDSSLMGHDHRPYRARTPNGGNIRASSGFGRPTPLIEIPVTWSLDDYALAEWGAIPGGLNVIQGRDAQELGDRWRGDFDTMADSESWGMIVYTFHPFLSARGPRMVAMLNLMRYLKDMNAHFVTMSEAASEAATHIDPLC